MIVPALIGGLGATELGLVLVLVLILFGAGRLPQVFGQFGKAMKNFRDAQREGADDLIDVSAGELPDSGPVADAQELKEKDRERA